MQILPNKGAANSVAPAALPAARVALCPRQIYDRPPRNKIIYRLPLETTTDHWMRVSPRIVD